jgi:hypothetical protein
MPIETSGLKLGELSQSGKGTKTVPITGNASYAPGDLRVLWNPRAFDGSDQSRVSISFEPTTEVEADITALEAWVLQQVSQDPTKYFGQTLTPSQIQDRFTSVLKTSEKGYRSLRAKMNLHGRNAVRCWDVNKASRDLPEDWTTCSVQPKFLVKGLWMMSRDWGLLLELTDALVSESNAACPF